MFCGLYAIVLATGVQGEPNFYRAAVMVLFACIFDMLDGRVARLTHTQTAFGYVKFLNFCLLTISNPRKIASQGLNRGQMFMTKVAR